MSASFPEWPPPPRGMGCTLYGGAGGSTASDPSPSQCSYGCDLSLTVEVYIHVDFEQRKTFNFTQLKRVGMLRRVVR